MRFFLVPFATAVALLSGCAVQPAFKPMPAAAVQKVKNSDIEVLISQKELNASINNSNLTAAAGGGLLFALIDTAVNNSREDDAQHLIVPLRNALLDYSFNDQAMEAVKRETGNISWIAEKNVMLLTKVTNQNVEKAIAESKKDVFTTIAFAYELSPDMKTITVIGHANAFPNTDELKALQLSLYQGTSKVNDPSAMKTLMVNSIYRDRVVFHETLPGDIKDRSAAIALWSANGGELARKALDHGVDVVASLLARDFIAANTPVVAGAISKQPDAFLTDIDGQKMSATRDKLGSLVVVVVK